MAKLVRARLDDGTEITLGESFAKSHNLEILDKPTHRHGRVAPAKRRILIKGAELDEALTRAKLPTKGTAAEKRARLADHQASGASVVGGASPTTGGESATSKEDS